MNDFPQTALQQAKKTIDQYFDQLYLYFVRRVRTKRIVAVLMESVFKEIFLQLQQSPTQVFSFADVLKIAWKFLSTELEKTYGQQKTHEKPPERIHYFDDVYRLKSRTVDTPSKRKDQTFERPPELDFFYTHLLPLEREVLWLTIFEGLSDADRSHVLGMNESDCTQLFYSSLKKAKDLLDQATAHQKIPQRFAPYFGNVLQLLQKSKEEERVEIDHDLKNSLSEKFMPVSTPKAQEVKRSSEKIEVEQPPFMSASMEEAEEQSSTEEQVLDSWEEEDTFSWGELFRRFQSVFLLILIVFVSVGIYFWFFSQSAQVGRLLADERVIFATNFSEEEKDTFAREALLYLAKRRDFVRIFVEKLNGKRRVNFELVSGLKEEFIIAPHAKPWPWQTKSYRQIAKLEM